MSNPFYVGQTDYIDQLNILAATLGSPGPPGTQIYNGAGAPSNGTGVNGDYYIDSSSFDFYGPKSGGVWGSPLLNLAGGSSLKFHGQWDDTTQETHTLVWYQTALWVSTALVNPGDDPPGKYTWRNQPLQGWLQDGVTVEDASGEAEGMGGTNIQARGVLEAGSLSKLLIYPINVTSSSGNILFTFNTPSSNPIPWFNVYFFSFGSIQFGQQLASQLYPGSLPFTFEVDGVGGPDVYFLVVEIPSTASLPSGGGLINLTATSAAGLAFSGEITNKWDLLIPAPPEYLDIFRGRLTAWSPNYIDYQVLADSFSYTGLDGTRHLIIDAGGALTNGTITMPPTPTPNFIFTISSTDVITAVTFTPNAGQSIKGAPAGFAAAGAYSFVWRVDDTTWYPT